MALDEETKNYLAKIVVNLASAIDKNNVHLLKRLDDIESRLQRIESNIFSMSKDTKQIPQMFELFEIDGEDIAALKSRVNSLEN